MAQKNIDDKVHAEYSEKKETSLEVNEFILVNGFTMDRLCFWNQKCKLESNYI